jgi:crotonobetainyl-CoA:carnitine CoA-transferase CaiB-like acyl-CoA transferase
MADDRNPPLVGVRVLDASRVLAGPFCGQVLGDLGAEVIKVERPGAGDETRTWGPPFLDLPGLAPLSAYYLSCNRNKRGITLDLAQPEGQDVFRRLVAASDVLLENLKAESAQKLGLDPAQLLREHPRLIVCSISGFGRTGPLAELPGYDFAIQALSGLMSITGPVDGPPTKVGVAAADVLTGLYGAVAVLAGLRGRERSGHGYAIDLALLDCAIAAQVNVAQAFLTSGRVPTRQGNAHLQIVPYQLFATADGWLVLAVGNDGQFRRFCDAAGKGDWLGDERFAANRRRVENRAILVPKIEELMRTRTTVAWREALTAVEVPHAPLWTYADLFAHPQVAARGMRLTVTDPLGRPVELVGSPFHFSGTDPVEPQAPPALGAHTDDVLKELLGLDAAALRGLRERGVI